eukprot:3484703-Pyramimonas_sp.AAC.1
MRALGDAHGVGDCSRGPTGTASAATRSSSASRRMCALDEAHGVGGFPRGPRPSTSPRGDDTPQVLLAPQ